jgi:hypothetical protein
MQGVELSGLEVIKPDVGTGLSPLMEPTSLASMSMPLDLDLRTSADNLEALLAGGSGSFNSAFKNYQPSPKQEPSAIRPSPSTRSLSLDSPAPLSFANVSALTSQSPTTAPPQPNVSSEPAPFATASIRSPTLATPKTATTAIAPSFAEGLPTGLQRRATAGESAEQDHTRIQVRFLILFSCLCSPLPASCTGLRQARIPFLRHLHPEAQRHHRPSSGGTYARFRTSQFRHRRRRIATCRLHPRTRCASSQAGGFARTCRSRHQRRRQGQGQSSRRVSHRPSSFSPSFQRSRCHRPPPFHCLPLHTHRTSLRTHRFHLSSPRRAHSDPYYPPRTLSSYYRRRSGTHPRRLSSTCEASLRLRCGSVGPGGSRTKRCRC